MSRHVTISPITRLEGHGKIDIILDDQGEVKDAFLQVVEFRGFEKFCEGRPVEELIRITPKICGVCPGAHHMASAKAADAVYGITIPDAAKKLRELYLNAHIAHSHMLHFFALAAPDFIPGAGAAPGERNLLGLVEKVGKTFAREILKQRGHCQTIQGIIAGHPIHPVCAIPGGMSQPLSESSRDDIEQMVDRMLPFVEQTLVFFKEKILGVKELAEIIQGDVYHHRTHYAGLVDGNGDMSFYDGEIRMIDPDGRQVAQFPGHDYLEHIGEKVASWSYLKFPYIKDVGWTGLTDGPQSGVYRVNALARLNVCRGLTTPRAQWELDHMVATFGGKPIHHTMAFHWSRLIETLYAAERMAQLIRDPEITSADLRVIPTQTPNEGVGVVEAPRGTLIHHYITDKKGIVTKANLIVATVQNNAGMCLSVSKAARHYIHGGNVNPEILDRVEMAFRAYDPCLACATHALPGHMPLSLTVHASDGTTRTIKRNLD